MKELTITFGSEQERIEFVKQCEADFEKRLVDATHKIVNSNSKIVLLSGPTCSGKTTTAKKLIDDFISAGKEVIVISIDDFFKERVEERIVVKDKKIDYDSVDALDLELLTQCVKSIKAGNTISVPVFDFMSQKRNGVNKHKITENSVIIFEGIQAVYPEVVALFDGNYEGIFIDVSEDVYLNGVFFSKYEIRLIRRLVRDRKFRGATGDFTLYLWETVRENEDKSIYPNKNVCQVQLNSFMGYELFLMRRYVINVLSEISENSPYFCIANQLKEKLLLFDDIDFEHIPKGSLYEEFLGKK